MISLFCRHEWEKLEEKLCPSAVERLAQTVKIAKVESVPPWAWYASVVIILVCKKCGKLDKTIVGGE